MPPGDPRNRWGLAGVVATVAVVLAVPLPRSTREAPEPGLDPQGEAKYVGSERCQGCHTERYAQWQGSHHARAMQVARDGTVLGDFGGATFEHRGKTWRFFRQGARFMVHAEGPYGKMSDFEVAYVFGIEPLQQYLVALPGGRLQALSAAWDTGARRWFHVHAGPGAPPGNWLHWTRPGQNWNAMCADCHSTAVRKRHAPEVDAYRTTWSEISVGCEACHGPGSRHADWAAQPAGGRPPVENAALLTRTSGLGGPESVTRCAPCHARRSQFSDPGVPGGEWMEYHQPALLEPGLFHPDGQVLDEDFEWQAFTQSKMYASGVRCSDCHDVHSAKLHRQGNALCTGCHPAGTYDAPSHHFHGPEWQGQPSAGVLCVSCHMPSQTYMGVHPRRDHSLRIPRPDLTAAIGVPNACSGCHADKPLSWIQEKYDDRYGKKRKPHYGTILAAGRKVDPAAEGDLVQLSQDPLRPLVARATAVDLLGAYPGPEARDALTKALASPEPLLRATAARRLPVGDPVTLVRLLGTLLEDPVRAVRNEAAARLAGAPAARLAGAERSAYVAALDGYIEGQRYMSDLPSGPFNLGNLYAAQGRAPEAERQYRRALALDDQLFPARANLAQLLSGQGRRAEAATLLREARSQRPNDAALAFNLGLLLGELGEADEAEQALRAALRADARLAPAAFNLAVLLGVRQLPEATRLAQQAASLAPGVPRYAWTLGYFQARAGDLHAAAATLEALRARFPEHADTCGLLADIYARQGRTREAESLPCRRRPGP